MPEPRRPLTFRSVLFFGLSSWVLVVVLACIMLGSTAVGLLVGRAMGGRSDALREPFGVLQGALVGFMGLVLAFGLTLAVGRYESRRADVVAEANAIGTTYLRAQTLAEPVRSESLDLLRDYTDVSIALSSTVPGSAEHRRVIADSEGYQRRLWALAGQALDDAPVASAPALFVDRLDGLFHAQAGPGVGLANPGAAPRLLLEVAGAAIAIAAL